MTYLQTTINDVEKEKKKLEKQEDDLGAKLVQVDKGLSQKRTELYKKRKELSNTLSSLAPEADYKRKKSQLGTLFFRDNGDLTDVLICNDDGIGYLSLPTEDKKLFLRVAKRIKKPDSKNYLLMWAGGFSGSFVAAAYLDHIDLFQHLFSSVTDDKLIFYLGIWAIGSAISAAIAATKYYANKNRYEAISFLYPKYSESQIKRDPETIRTALQPIKE